MPTYSALYVHVIFATKGRAPIIGQPWLAGLHAYMAGVITNLNGSAVVIGGVADHVHCLIRMKPKTVLADLVRELKKASNNWAKERFEQFEWQGGYAAFSVGRLELDRARAYIENQEEHHRKWSSQDELRAIMAEHGIEIDERFFE